jgi:hypothetical protein
MFIKPIRELLQVFDSIRPAVARSFLDDQLGGDLRFLPAREVEESWKNGKKCTKE